MKIFLLIVSLSFIILTGCAKEIVSLDEKEIILETIQKQSEKLKVLEDQVKDLLKLEELTAIRLEETFQTIFCFLGEIKWLINGKNRTVEIKD